MIDWHRYGIKSRHCHPMYSPHTKYVRRCGPLNISVGLNRNRKNESRPATTKKHDDDDDATLVGNCYWRLFFQSARRWHACREAETPRWAPWGGRPSSTDRQQIHSDERWNVTCSGPPPGIKTGVSRRGESSGWRTWAGVSCSTEGRLSRGELCFSTSRAVGQAKYCEHRVCLSVCLSVL